MEAVKVVRMVSDNPFKGVSRGDTLWRVGDTVSILPEQRGAFMCRPGMLHAYRSVGQAVLFHLIHGYGSDSSLAFLAVEGDEVARDATKSGFHSLYVREVLPYPEILCSHTRYRLFRAAVAGEVALSSELSERVGLWQTRFYENDILPVHVPNPHDADWLLNIKSDSTQNLAYALAPVLDALDAIDRAYAWASQAFVEEE